MPLKGKTVYITGGTGGIGSPLVTYLREAGAEVTVYNTKTEGDLVKNIAKTSAHLTQNTPDILINMAGMHGCDFCENQNTDALIALNLTVPIKLIQAVLPHMKTRNAGHIINIGSMTGVIPLPHMTGYVAAKSGLKGFTDALRRELGGTNITVSLIMPRAVRTKMNNGVSDDINQNCNTAYDLPEDVAKRILKAIILREGEVRFGWPERIFAFLNANLPRIVDHGLQKNRKIGDDILLKTTNTK